MMEGLLHREGTKPYRVLEEHEGKLLDNGKVESKLAIMVGTTTSSPVSIRWRVWKRQPQMPSARVHSHDVQDRAAHENSIAARTCNFSFPEDGNRRNCWSWPATSMAPGFV